MSEDEELVAALSALDPSPPQVARMRDVVLAAHAPLPPLTTEWLELLRVRPVANTFVTFAAAAVLILGAAMTAIPWQLLAEL